MYRELEDEGLTFTLRGIGTFVTEDAHRLKKLKKKVAQEAVDTFLKEMYEMNFNNSEIIDILKDEMEVKND